MSKLQESGTLWMRCDIAKASTQLRSPFGKTRAVALEDLHAERVKHLAVHVQKDWHLSTRDHYSS